MAQQYTNRAASFGVYLGRLREHPAPYATLKELRADEAQLVKAVRTAGRHANFALDELEAQSSETLNNLIDRITSVSTPQPVVPAAIRARKL